MQSQNGAQEPNVSEIAGTEGQGEMSSLKNLNMTELYICPPPHHISQMIRAQMFKDDTSV